MRIKDLSECAVEIGANVLKSKEVSILHNLFTERMQSLKPGLHIVVTIAEYACDDVLKRVLKLLIYRLQIFLVKYEYLRSLQPCKDQGVPGKLKKRVCNHVLAILTAYMEIRLKFP